ncbi:MAG: hypothetical protein EOO89_10310 [Pedobacter sp.]|nr:MAG: hypothetical protein EOO89_10310 [Pedobacter sp.]
MNTKFLKNIALVAIVAATFSACKKDTNEIEVPVTENKEFKYLRVLVTDELSSKITMIDPFEAKVNSFDTKYPLASIYGISGGRYAAVLYGSQNLAEVFDTGLQTHTDHVDIVNSGKWAAISATNLKPTHFKSSGTESLIFNDGEGTLSLGVESDFNTAGAKFKTINAGINPHHGAMAQFDNATIAVTTAPVGGSANRVIVIDKQGKHLHESTMEIGAIHGNATDGRNAVFGGFTTSAATSGGVLVVSETGTQKLIPNPEGFGAFRLATILYAESANKFIGYVASKGAYMIDIVANKITPIYTGNDAYQCKVDFSGKKLYVLTLDGKLRIYDLQSGALSKEGNVTAAVVSTDTYKPVLEATAKYIYIAQPATGEVAQIDVADFSKVIKHKVSSRPVRLALTGFESNAGHND